MNCAIADTNLILRFLTGQPESQANSARNLLEQCELGKLQLRIPVLVVAEVVFVLTGKIYAFTTREVASVLTRFLESRSLVRAAI